MNLRAIFAPHDPVLVKMLCELAVENALLKAKAYWPTREKRRDSAAFIAARDAKTAALRKCVGAE